MWPIPLPIISGDQTDLCSSVETGSSDTASNIHTYAQSTSQVNYLWICICACAHTHTLTLFPTLLKYTKKGVVNEAD